MKIVVGVSNRHVHLNEQTYIKLFGNNKITKRNELKQANEFASNSVIILKSGKFEIPNVRVMGPFRSYNQVEISKTDAYFLKLNPPVRKSGDLKNADNITLVGPSGEVYLEEACIIAERHLHIDEEEALENNLKEGDNVKININTEKPGSIFAKVKIIKNGFRELHLDTDDANAFLLRTDDEVDIEL